MAIPYQPQNLVAQQADGNVLLTWSSSSSATSYKLQKSPDNISWFDWATIVATGDNAEIPLQYVDDLIQEGSTGSPGNQLWYRVAAVNGSGVSPYSSVATAIPAPPGELSLYELRQRSQETADRVGSQFVTMQEWNAFLRLALYELYDLLIGTYEDYGSSASVTISTTGSQQNYPLPDGMTNYPGGALDNNAAPSFIFLNGQGQITSPGDVYQSNGWQFTVKFATNSGSTNLDVTGIGTPASTGFLSKVSGDPNSASIIRYFNVQYGLATYPAPAFYKLAGVDLAVNTSTVNPAWVTLKKFNFIDRNKYVYPNSTSTIYGVYNQAYRLMGNTIQFIPVPAGNQTLRLTYAPRLPALLRDSDLTTIGHSGWLRYPIVRAAKYALDKEEGSDTSKLDAELLFLKTRIEQMASNRDEGMPDTISETRRDGIYGGTGWGDGGQGGF